MPYSFGYIHVDICVYIYIHVHQHNMYAYYAYHILHTYTIHIYYIYICIYICLYMSVFFSSVLMLQLVTTPTHADPEDMGAYGIHPAYSLEQTHMRVSSSENGGTPIAGWFL